MFEKMLESPYLATVGFKKNIPDITGKVCSSPFPRFLRLNFPPPHYFLKVVEVKNADAAKQMAQSETTSSVELALGSPFPSRCFENGGSDYFSSSSSSPARRVLLP